MTGDTGAAPRNLGGTDLKRLHRDWRRRTDGRLALILDGLQGPFNIGAIIRTAAAERVDHVWFAGGAMGPDNPKVGRTALGTEKYLTHDVVATAADAIAAARATGYRIVGVELATGARPLHELELRCDVCLVIGHEDRGLSRDALGACDDLGFIPQLGRVGSLNVATAASIAMYEVRRRRWTEG